MASFEWNETIKEDDKTNVLLEPGDYCFRVSSRDLTRVKTGANMGENALRLNLVVWKDGSNELSDVSDFMVLLPSTIWKLRKFWACTHPDYDGVSAFCPDPNDITGKTGVCRLKVDTFDSTREPGTKISVNKVDEYYKHGSKPFTPEPTGDDDMVF